MFLSKGQIPRIPKERAESMRSVSRTRGGSISRARKRVSYRGLRYHRRHSRNSRKRSVSRKQTIGYTSADYRIGRGGGLRIKRYRGPHYRPSHISKKVASIFSNSIGVCLSKTKNLEIYILALFSSFDSGIRCVIILWNSTDLNSKLVRMYRACEPVTR